MKQGRGTDVRGPGAAAGNDAATTHARDPQAVAAARAGFSAWLRAAREARGVELEHIAKVTKIQLRTLELLEDGLFEHLPADVFVRGFIRNYTRVVGIDGALALARYDECGVSPGPAARARVDGMIETMAPLAPSSAQRVGRRSQQHTVPPVAALPAAPQILASGSLQMPAAAPPVVEAAAEPVVEAVAEPVVEAAAAPVVEAAAEPVVQAVAEPVVEAVAQPVVEAAAEPATRGKRARKRGERRGRGRQKARATTEAPVVAVAAAVGEPVVGVVGEPVLGEPAVVEPVVAELAADPAGEGALVITIEANEPTQPLAAAAPSVVDAPATIEAEAATAAGPVVVSAPAPVSWAAALFRPRAQASASPVLTIDDDDPESAEREREARQQPDASRRSFLPPSLLDGDRGTRQGGLTLAVIILLIVATLTLSYLMRRPSSAGEGITLDTSSAPVHHA